MHTDITWPFTIMHAAHFVLLCCFNVALTSPFPTIIAQMCIGLLYAFWRILKHAFNLESCFPLQYLLLVITNCICCFDGMFACLGELVLITGQHGPIFSSHPHGFTATEWSSHASL